jgi:hypothetical protein
VTTGNIRTRVYIAGPLSKGNLEENILQATTAALVLIKAGYAPLCPHLSSYIAGPVPDALPAGTAHADWCAIGLAWVSAALAVLRLPGESIGADQETDLARRLGIPVYHSLAELLSLCDPCQADWL